MTRALHHATRVPAASLLLASTLLLAACHSPPTRAPEDLPRGSYLGSGSPMTNREASREPARARSPIAKSTQSQPDDAGIDVPWNSSAARMNWRPVETEPDDEPEPNDNNDDSADADIDNDTDADADNDNDADADADNDLQGDVNDAPPGDRNKNENKNKNENENENESPDKVQPTGDADVDDPK